MEFSVTIIAIIALQFIITCSGEADRCTPDVCKLENGCRCSSAVAPVLEGELPQLISLTFNEAVVKDLIDDYWEPLLFDLTNPDGAPIGGTFFVPHEYTDYQMVAELYNYGFEIGVHSISKNPLQEYWRYAPLDTLQKEFSGARQIISHFSKVPMEEIIGVRTPQFQLGSDNSFQAYKDAGLVYDSSWPTMPDSPIFPYSMDFKSTQKCDVAETCPTDSFPGLWVLPIIDLQGEISQCISLATCGYNSSSKQEILDWLNREVDRRAGKERAPLTMVIESYWFKQSEHSYAALREFLVSLARRNDVFLVSQSQVLHWIKNPVPLKDFKTQTFNRFVECRRPLNCRLRLDANNIRYMVSCIQCPSNYPWLGNPFGN